MLCLSGGRMLPPLGECLQLLLDFCDAIVRGGGAGGHTYGIRWCEPFFAQILRRLHVVHTRAVTAASLDQLVGIIAVRASNHHDDVGLLSQGESRILSLLGWLANGVDKAYFGG